MYWIVNVAHFTVLCYCSVVIKLHRLKWQKKVHFYTVSDSDSVFYLNCGIHHVWFPKPAWAQSLILKLKALFILPGQNQLKERSETIAQTTEGIIKRLLVQVLTLSSPIFIEFYFLKGILLLIIFTCTVGLKPGQWYQLTSWLSQPNWIPSKCHKPDCYRYLTSCYSLPEPDDFQIFVRAFRRATDIVRKTEVADLIITKKKRWRVELGLYEKTTDLMKTNCIGSRWKRDTKLPMRW